MLLNAQPLLMLWMLIYEAMLQAFTIIECCQIRGRLNLNGILNP